MMWARVSEALLGAWLIVSAGVFSHIATGYLVNDVACGALVMILALLPFRESMRYVHWGILPVSIWLVGISYFTAPHPAPGHLVNDLFVGTLLVMFAVVPTEASMPPPEWREEVTLQ